MSGEASFRNHMAMISLNEPTTRKAKFWQSYVRALKGTDDMRADDSTFKRPSSRAFSELPDLFGRPSSDPAARIFAPGYRYLPVSRDTYGYSPRAIYGIDRPSAYAPRAASMPPGAPGPYSALKSLGINEPQALAGADNFPNWREDDPDTAPSKYPKSYYLPTPWSSSATPTYVGTGLPTKLRPYRDLLNPSPFLPITAVTRDPWWYDGLGLKPYGYTPRSIVTYPSALRNSYLSPIRNHYLWSQHPLRAL